MSEHILEEVEAKNNVSIVLFSGDLDKVLAAFIIATGAAASGMQVNIFFTFWGLAALRKDGPGAKKKSFIGKLFGMMLPKGAKKLALSQMNMAGMGTAMIKGVMRGQKVASLPELMEIALELGVHMHPCEMSMNLMGLKKEELLTGIEESVGVATYIAQASASHMTLFI